MCVYSRTIQYSKPLLLAACLSVSAPALAFDWSDTSLNWRYGSSYAEPFNNTNISKHILGLTHVDGYQYGSNFINVDLLISDAHDPKRFGTTSGAQEVYVVYRHKLDIGKLRGSDIRFGPVRGLGLTAGFDWNMKQDAGYNSRKQMLVIGPTLMMDVAGFLDVSLLFLAESNKPSTSPGAFNPSYPAVRYHYKTHPMLALAWSMPVGENLSFGGYANFIEAKGLNEVGASTAAETNIDMNLMLDISPSLGSPAKTFQVGVAYQFWKNKFGNNHAGPAGKGAYAKTPMMRAEYHF